MRRTCLLLIIVLLALPTCSKSRKGANSARPAAPVVRTGLDVAVASDFDFFRGKKVGIVCNHTACDQRGRHIVDLFSDSQQCSVVAIFGPEHGFRGDHADGNSIRDTIDARSGARIYSLYGQRTKPEPRMLEGVDMLVYDIQDVGVRFYTYISTMANAMEAAFEKGIPFVVLDRPNPIGGDRIEGPILDPQYRSFVGMYPIPIRYGLTVGELAMLIYGEGWVKSTVNSNLFVMEMEGWKRGMWYDETGLPWIAPSPNMTTLETATVYPGFCLLEGTNLSEGRGTETPFLIFGAPWIDAKSLLRDCQQEDWEGVEFRAAKFTPRSIPGRSNRPKYRDQLCEGLRIQIMDREHFLPLPTMLRLLEKISVSYPDHFEVRENRMNRLYGRSDLVTVLSKNASVRTLWQDYRDKIGDYFTLREQYLLY